MATTSDHHPTTSDHHAFRRHINNHITLVHNLPNLDVKKGLRRLFVRQLQFFFVLKVAFGSLLLLQILF
jgi:hypothetical protein